MGILRSITDRLASIINRQNSARELQRVGTAPLDKTLTITSAPLADERQILKDVTSLCLTRQSLQEIEQQISLMLVEKLGLHFIGIYHLDLPREYAVLQYGTGEAGKQMLMASFRLAVGGFSVVGRCAKSGSIETAEESSTEATLTDNPFLPLSRSETAIPIVFDSNILGVLDVHAESLKPVDDEKVTLLRQVSGLLALIMVREASPARSNPPVTYDLIRKAEEYFHKDQLLSRDLVCETINSDVDQSETMTTHRIPLVVDNKTIGQLKLESSAKTLSDQQQIFITEVIAQTLPAFLRFWKATLANRQIELECRLLDFSTHLRATNDPQKMLQITLEEITRSMGVSRAQIVLNVPESPTLTSERTLVTRSMDRTPTTGKLPEI